MGIQTALDALRSTDHVVDAMRLADELAFESTRDPGVRTIRVLEGALDDSDQLVAIAAVHALGTITDDEASRTRRPAAVRTSALFVREHAAWVLGSGLPRADAIARLIGMTVDGRLRRDAGAADARAVVGHVGRAGGRRSGDGAARRSPSRPPAPAWWRRSAWSGTSSRSGRSLALAGDPSEDEGCAPPPWRRSVSGPGTRP